MSQTARLCYEFVQSGVAQALSRGDRPHYPLTYFGVITRIYCNDDLIFGSYFLNRH